MAPTSLFKLALTSTAVRLRIPRAHWYARVARFTLRRVVCGSLTVNSRRVIVRQMV